MLAETKRVQQANGTTSTRARSRWIAMWKRLGRLLRGCFAITSVVYVVGVAAVLLALRLVGEDWWVTTAALYLPRLVFALPLPCFVLGLFWLGFRRLLYGQVLAGALLLILNGWVVPLPTGGTDGAPELRVLSFNVDSGNAGLSAVVSAITAQTPDVVLLQEVLHRAPELARMLSAHYPHVEHSTQFVIASRFPILSRTDPERLRFYDRERSPRFMRYVVETPLGAIAFYNIHPISPRGTLQVYRVRDAFYVLRHRRFHTSDPVYDVQTNAALRTLQVAAVAAAARRETIPVVIAGDTNLPHLSKIYEHEFSEFRDGFREAGWGFGYTYPSKFPWLRLDRILTSRSLRFTAFDVGCEGASDHRCVSAAIQKR
jgi:vancomycin resistance protein VanJ